jgi:hypothetical protein
MDSLKLWRGCARGVNKLAPARWVSVFALRSGQGGDDILELLYLAVQRREVSSHYSLE